MKNRKMFIKTEQHCIRNSPVVCHQADIGYVCPIKTVWIDSQDKQKRLVVQPYQDANFIVKMAVQEALQQQWGNGDIMYDDDFINKIWHGPGVLYVMTLETEEDDSIFVGCVAVDRRNFKPFLSQLYIHPDFRGQRHSHRLIHVVCMHVSSTGFKEVFLWCDRSMVEFYEKNMWKVYDCETDDSFSSRDDNVVIMCLKM